MGQAAGAPWWGRRKPVTPRRPMPSDDGERRALIKPISETADTVTVRRADYEALLSALADAGRRLTDAEQAKETARKRAHELANRMMTLEAAAEEGRGTKEQLKDAGEQLAGLHDLLVDAERRLAEAENGRRTTQERLDAQDRAEAKRRGKGRWTRLRAVWREE